MYYKSIFVLINVITGMLGKKYSFKTITLKTEFVSTFALKFH